ARPHRATSRQGRPRPLHARRSRWQWKAGLSLAQRPALLAQIAEQCVVTADVLARRAAALPAAERLHAGPRAGRRARGAVDVDDARLDAVVEGVDLRLLAREQARGQPELRVVRARERVVQAVD